MRRDGLRKRITVRVSTPRDPLEREPVNVMRRELVITF